MICSFLLLLLSYSTALLITVFCKWPETIIPTTDITHTGLVCNIPISIGNVNYIAFNVLHYAYIAHNAYLVYYPFLFFYVTKCIKLAAYHWIWR